MRKGRPSAKLKQIFAGDEQKARERYRKEYLRIRQGVIQLLNERSEVVNQYQAPMLRCRW